ncbi:hypothetical protein AB1Y20_013849 [Prymnesium parvum]|uniref:Uncharacterized protein n=1 Tax=Prymnesium parvum TaxID=97485 RepID=A0AB34IE45_PRYPA
MDFALPDPAGVGPSNPALLRSRGADPLIEPLPHPPATRNAPVAPSHIAHQPDPAQNSAPVARLQPPPPAAMPQQTTTTQSAVDSAQPSAAQSATQASSTSAPTVEHQLQALQRQIDALTFQNEALVARFHQADHSAPTQGHLRPATAPLSTSSARADPSSLPPMPLDPSHPSAAPADPPRLDRADLKRLTTSLEPGRVERWISNLIDTLEDYSRDAAELLRMPPDRRRFAQH